MHKSVLVLGAAALLAACNQGGGGEPANASANAAANAAAEPQRPKFCFFKDEETKGWAASRAANGDIGVKGKAHVKDSRYQATLGEPVVAGGTATLWLTLGTNSGAFAAPDNWWDVSASVPASSGVSAVTVKCGDKTLAELQVPQR